MIDVVRMRADTWGRPYARVFSGAAICGRPYLTFRAYDEGGHMGPPLRDEQARGVRLEVALRAAARDRREDFVEVGDADEVAFVFVEGELAVRDRLRLVAAHRRGDVDVFAALPEVHFHGDVFEAEAPRSGIELRLPCGAARSAAECFGHVLGEVALETAFSGLTVEQISRWIHRIFDP